MKAFLFLIMTVALLLGKGAKLPRYEQPGSSTSTTAVKVTGISFETTDRDGNTVTQDVLGRNKLTMLNFWEPWCGPCVSEMPDLEKLSKAYADRGFAILGIYSTEGMEGDVDDVLSETGVSYTILHYAEAFDRFQTGYVPTTVFLDSSGNQVGETQIGSMDYESWAAVVEELLG